jgi:radical SAM superfamily enzyme YgiQ (UPF0313 family)
MIDLARIQQQDDPERTGFPVIIELCRRRGKPVAIGGPDAMSSSDTYRYADFLVLGEAEGLIDQFVAAWFHAGGSNAATVISPSGGAGQRAPQISQTACRMVIGIEGGCILRRQGDHHDRPVVADRVHVEVPCYRPVDLIEETDELLGSEPT